MKETISIEKSYIDARWAIGEDILKESIDDLLKIGSPEALIELYKTWFYTGASVFMTAFALYQKDDFSAEDMTDICKSIARERGDKTEADNIQYTGRTH